MANDKKKYTLPEAEHKKLIGISDTAFRNREPWWQTWRELGKYYSPHRIPELMDNQEIAKKPPAINENILDPTGTIAADINARGLMNGVSSPSRPWFYLSIEGFENNRAVLIWAEEVRKTISKVMEESNFYEVLNQLYSDMSVFGTSTMLIYEDKNNDIHCYHSPIGEYALGVNAFQQVDTYTRKITRTVRQVVQMFGIDNVDDATRAAYESGGARLNEPKTLRHLIIPNSSGHVAARFKFVDYYWLDKSNSGEFLRIRGYHEQPGAHPRTDIVGSSIYGVSPGLKALPLVRQLQQEVRRKLQGVDGMVRPHMLLPLALRTKGMSMLPGGQTFVPDPTNGARPAYEPRLPLGEMRLDIHELRTQIKQIFNNDLFNMISELDTVRSATEIDARKEEKLVQLGPLLKRTDNEVLDVAIERIFAILWRKNKLPSTPPELTESKASIKIQYTSLLHSAQKAASTAPVERLLQLVGNASAVWPDAAKKINIIELIDYYAKGLGIDPTVLTDNEELFEDIAAERDAQGQRQAIEDANNVAAGAQTLSKTDLGGGVNALQQLFAQQ